MVGKLHLVVEFIHRVIHRLLPTTNDKSPLAFSALVQRVTIVRFRVATGQGIFS